MYNVWFAYLPLVSDMFVIFFRQAWVTEILIEFAHMIVTVWRLIVLRNQFV